MPDRVSHRTNGSGLQAASLPPASHQTTLARRVHCRGTGLHSGKEISLSLQPAPAGSGIRFQRTDLPHKPAFRLGAENIVNTTLATVAAHPTNPTCRISTIEHLLGALHALEIDNLLIQVDGPELPVLDGCAEAFVFLLQCAGVTQLEAMRNRMEILQPIEVSKDGASARLAPLSVEEQASPGLYLDLSIAFPQSVIGRQSWSMQLNAQSFRQDIARARTFVAFEDIAALQAQGLARGGSLQNAVVVQDTQVLNPEGTRGKDEFVRHKVLDAIGDLYCNGLQIIGHFSGCRSGHALHNRLLRALMATPEAWRLLPAGAASTPEIKQGNALLPLRRLHDIRHLWSAVS
ncbi:UDP-3-O-acyl-N-acetylglucosamine deacetylase [Oecophyllibacter saccharovorans]|uniref:UDP-3-O-acyl-N-acetylglucosamine deacetylase n=1 Tax=Oecophyllibacter saccharovorans TaxID=2558360 RepID=A0A506UR30_9PROT|nr:UDP-3-O-acyl-N-acetylglucosamine deacetylase [Oecophyllibacter saccharovorans]TPW35811.1 UDP-3-O-[3-hydroxymyristoyl] N-acetylglucosamine deacetylase [Oecophyllibacter saccharovorans]